MEHTPLMASLKALLQELVLMAILLMIKFILQWLTVRSRIAVDVKVIQKLKLVEIQIIQWDKLQLMHRQTIKLDSKIFKNLLVMEEFPISSII
jgi:hypothetical protein